MYVGWALGKLIATRKAIARDLAALYEMHALIEIWWQDMASQAEALGLKPPPPFPAPPDHRP